MTFVDEQLDRIAPLWERMLSHRFLTDTRDGRIVREDFANWMRQDYLFVEAAIPFIGVLVGRAPDAHRGALGQVIGALERELAIFRERAGAAGVSLGEIPPSFTCHAYVQFLMSTAYRASYPGAFTVLWAAERAYLDSWKVVAEGLDPSSPWMPFVENWTGDDFAAYVAWLEEELEGLASTAGPREREEMAGLLELTVLYEIAFWDMALTGDGWPGAGEWRPPPRGATGEEREAVGDEAVADAGVRAWEGVVTPGRSGR